MQGMQRIRNHLGIVGRGAGAGCGGGTWCGVAAAVQEIHQQQACSTCWLVCCAAVQEGICRKAIRILNRTRTPDFQGRCSSAGRNRVHAQAREALDIKSSSREALIPSSPSDIGRAGSGNRACAAARPRGQVWRPWRCAAACRNAISRRAWGARRGRTHLAMRHDPWGCHMPCPCGHGAHAARTAAHGHRATGGGARAPRRKNIFSRTRAQPRTRVAHWARGGLPRQRRQHLISILMGYMDQTQV